MALHRHAIENLERTDALLFGRVTYQLMEEAFRSPVRSGGLLEWRMPFARTIDAAKKFVRVRDVAAHRLASLFRAAVELASDGSHEEERVLGLFHLAQVSVLRKDLESATGFTQQALAGAEWESSLDPAGMASRLQGWATSWRATIAGAGFGEVPGGAALAEDFAAVVLPLLRRAVELREELGDAAALAAAQRQLAAELAAAGRTAEAMLLLEELQGQNGASPTEDR